MARGFQIRRDVGNGKIVEREYELIGDTITLLVNRRIKISVHATDDPFAFIEAHERKTWPTLTGPLEIKEFESHSGTYLPSIARPIHSPAGALMNPAAENEMAKLYRREHNSIAADIEECFDVASPSTQNLHVFGTQFEKIIYFACVGVESLFNKILSDNNRNTKNVGTQTFVKLKPLLRIDEYELSLVHYPWLSALRPFGSWDSTHPSESLSWFDAYNSLKHAKRHNQHKATMQNALNAAAAYYALTYAVFGTKMFTGYMNEQFFFHFSVSPQWQVHEIYYPPEDGSTWQARKFLI